MKKPTGFDTIILIGPIGVGKSTVGKLLAQALDCTFTSLDDLEKGYITPLGYDHKRAMEIANQEGGFPFYAYRRSFFETAVIRCLEEIQEGVLEMGGGHPIMPAEANQQRITKAFAPFKHVILLIPSANPEDFIPRLRKRRKLPRHADDFNELYFQDDTFMKLAKHVVFTEDKTPVEIVSEIQEWLIKN